MPSYEVTYAETKKLTMWVPEGASHSEKASLALDHIAMNTYQGTKSKLLEIEPTPTTTLEQITEPTNVAPIK
jgi:hypothetical protein